MILQFQIERKNKIENSSRTAWGVDSKVFEELVSNEQVIPEVGQSAMDKVKLFMKKIPDVFNNQDSTD